jgi:pantothenate kinase type III
MIRRYRAVLGENAAVVATGGFSGVIAPAVNRDHPRPRSCLDGLYAIAVKNSK